MFVVVVMVEIYAGVPHVIDKNVDILRDTVLSVVVCSVKIVSNDSVGE